MSDKDDGHRSDVDAELLDMIGGDSSDEESDAKPSAKTPASPSPGMAEPVGRAQSPLRRGVAQKVRARKGAAKQRKREEEDAEDGEASSIASSPNSLGSGAMSESESDTSPGDDGLDDAPLYPIEGKFTSEKDHAEIMAMTEIQREGILADRAAEAQRRRQDQELKRLLATRDRDRVKSVDKRKRKAGPAELEDGQRKSTRQKVKASEPLEAYKRQRELKGAQRRGVDEARDRTSPSRDSERDADGESEVDWDDGKPRASSLPHEEPAAKLQDFEYVRIGRTNFAKVCYYPTFEQAITGCFCRVSIGLNRETGQNTYRMAQIKGFATGKPYQMEGANNKTFVTDLYIIAAHGKAEKEWPFLACSDSKFTEQEFDRYKRAVANDHLRLTSKSLLRSKLDGIHALLNHQWTEEDIQKKINKIAEVREKLARLGREKIAARRREAGNRGDETAVMECDAELAAMDGGLSRTAMTAAAAKNTAKGEQQERLAALNRANRKANSENIRKVQLEQKRHLQKAREEAIARTKKIEEEEKAAAEAKRAQKKLLGVPGAGADDLFGDGSDISRIGTPMNALGTPRGGTPAVGEKKKSGGLKKKNMDDDITGLDLGIEIDI
ncbi:RNA polymerase-associated protein rtf1 [Elasticomyces elasticus]|nr:RNA polymerase-associated protein rtf1 [Elasticomyces elasticus]